MADVTDSVDWQRVKQLFNAGQRVANSQRDAWLAEQCKDDAALRKEVDELLRAQNKSHQLLDHGAIDLIRQLNAGTETDDTPTQIGDYTIIRLLGQGGMGSVFLARHGGDEFDHRVALKLIRTDSFGAASRERFLRERAILARLSHPNIARLFDGGMTADEMPYFTMEYVEGEPVTTYCDSRGVSVRDRIGIVLQLCSAIDFAHRNLIVHRDLKPSNILVASDGATKLLDFGIAKLLDADVGEFQTETQSRMMTPEYAAPEQILGEPVTTAVDVYAIGVLLYELLSGRSPYARAEAGDTSWMKAIVDEAPEPISRALMRPFVRGNALTSDIVASQRGTHPTNLKRALRGDLDRILRRALAKQPEARYPSVGAFAADLDAFVAGRAISGSRLGYRVRKFITRFWMPLSAATLVFVGAIATGAVLLRQARAIEREASTTLTVTEFLYGLFTAVDPHQAKGREISARELLDRGAERIEANAALDIDQHGEIESTLGRIYFGLGQFEQADKLQAHALQLLSKNKRNANLIARVEGERAETLADEGDLKTAASLLVDAQSKLGDDAPADERAQLLHTHVVISSVQQDYATAKRYADAYLELVRSESMDDALLFQALLAAGSARTNLSEPREAEPFFREALAVALRQEDADSLDVARAKSALGEALQSQPRYAEAADMQTQGLATDQKVLGADHPDRVWRVPIFIAPSESEPPVRLRQ